jgi:hypothetical protein
LPFIVQIAFCGYNDVIFAWRRKRDGRREKEKDE